MRRARNFESNKKGTGRRWIQRAVLRYHGLTTNKNVYAVQWTWTKRNDRACESRINSSIANTFHEWKRKKIRILYVITVILGRWQCGKIGKMSEIPNWIDRLRTDVCLVCTTENVDEKPKRRAQIRFRWSAMIRKRDGCNGHFERCQSKNRFERLLNEFNHVNRFCREKPKSIRSRVERCMIVVWSFVAWPRSPATKKTSECENYRVRNA